MAMRRLLLFVFLISPTCQVEAQDRSVPEAEPQIWQMVFLGPEQVVPIEIRIQSQEGPTARRRKLAEMLLVRFDTDKDGQLSSAEAAKLPAGAKPSGTPLGDSWKSLDLPPHDQQLGLNELVAFVDRELGPTFQISTRPPRLAQSVQLVERIDQDGDSAVSVGEIERSLAPLRQSDLDDDEAVSVGELQPFPRRGIVRQATPQPIDSPFISVSRSGEVETASERIVNRYGQGKAAVPLSVVGEVGQSADRDGDGQLNPEELKGWLNQKKPEWVVTANLNRNRASTVTVRSASDNSKMPATKPGPRAAITLAGAGVEFVVQNNSAEQLDASRMYGTRFLQSDRDKNGYLNDMEFPGLQLNVPFGDVDANSDGMLMRDELSTFVSFDAIAIQARMELMVADVGGTLFELLDANTDRRLTPRELREGFGRLTSVDRNQDQKIAQSELESRYQLTFSFGRNQIFTPRVGGMDAPVTARLRNQNNGPVWYRRMDRNQDGDITWREFLGTRDQFQNLDASGDGLISREEADAAPVPMQGASDVR